ncbi:MAG: hypothetical protein AAF721_26050 [Myxococcota bacterium]
MVERCELCGARLRAEDEACRECGTKRADAVASGEGAPAEASSDPAPPSSDPAPAAEPSMSFADIATPPSIEEPRTGPHLEVPAEASLAQAPAALPDVPLPGAVATASPEVPAPAPIPPPPPMAAPHPETEADPTAPEQRLLTAPELQFGEPASSINFEDARGSRTGLWVVLVLLLVGGGVAAAVMLGGDDDAEAAAPIAEAPAPETVTAPVTPPDPAPTEACDGVTELAGAWNFATEVTAARSAKKLGIRGHYTAEFTVEACTAKAAIAKTGFTGSTFPTRHVQRATSTLERGEGGLAFAFGNRFVLRDEKGKGVDQEFYFVVFEETLVGVWRQRGSEWDHSGLHGILIGSRETDSNSLEPRFDALPCGGRCAMTCDLLASGTETAGVEACEAACTEDPDAIPACGAREAPSVELQLALEGPKAELGALCPKFKCDLDPKMRRGRGPRVESSTGAIRGAHFVHSAGKGQGRKGSMRIALKTEAGWYLSAPLRKLAGTKGIKEVDHARMGSTSFGAGPEAQTIVGQLEIAHRDLMVACRPETGGPVCVVIRSLANTGAAAVLPGGTVALRSAQGVTLQAW